MLQTLYVHIGPPKTGTTSIQTTFYRNAALFAENGFYYYSGHINHRPIAHYMHEADRLPRHTVHYKRFLAGAAASPCKAGLLSSEFLIRLNGNEVKAECEALRGIAREIKVVCYARHPVSLAISAAHQAVRGGKPVSVVEERPNMSRVSPLLKRWKRAIGRENIIVRPFDRADMVDGDVVSDFLEVVGLGHLRKQLEPMNRNPGLSVLGVQVLDAVARRLEDEPLQIRHIPLLRFLEGPRYVLPPASIEKVRREMADEIEELRTEWGVTLREPELPPYTPPPLSEAEANSLADALVAILRLVPPERSRKSAFADRIRSLLRPGRRRGGDKDEEEAEAG